MRVLLTGATGNVGRGVLQALANRGHVVLAAGRDTARLRETCGGYGPNVELHTCDLSVGDLSLPNDYDAVVHSAAHATAQDDPDAHVLHNVIATRNLLRHAARKPGRPFIFFSSLSVYGTVEASCVDEQTAILNPGSYGASKLLGEMMLEEYGSVFSSVALRLPGILGPGARDPWLARVLRAARAGQPVTIYSPDTRFNNAVHVDDLGTFVDGLLSRATRGFDVLTLGTSDSASVRDVVIAMLREVQAPLELRSVEATRQPFTISITKAAARYGFQPAGIFDTVRRFARSAVDVGTTPHAAASL
jgi:nucleoside-diphosphate-sugar epimerase